MSQSAYIKLVEGSTAQDITLQDIRDTLAHYVSQTALTGEQLGWDYANAAFPYTEESAGDDRWFYLKGTARPYKYMILGTSVTTSVAGSDVNCIQVVLPEGSTHGDKAKGNELCKYMAKKLKAELTMFNGRTIYYNPRK
ncbi:DUF1885 family protein [Paenibacillus sp. PAMC21692]|uniref:DUF1885 family protein n=1 Tax=Paenibacillus sp. PAMC21692 TaxID=2762320 RepID=UPI00164DFC09|nr:DUF1885 family protein [Paenibacillus sp. PAMC21692]QNK54596.1 DUF1885 family protein [Paenibacillus sp. PAMC21692]